LATHKRPSSSAFSVDAPISIACQLVTANWTVEKVRQNEADNQASEEIKHQRLVHSPIIKTPLSFCNVA